MVVDVQPGWNGCNGSGITILRLTNNCIISMDGKLVFSSFKGLFASFTAWDALVLTVTHLAFYSGWPPATSAVLIAKAEFAAPED